MSNLDKAPTDGGAPEVIARVGFDDIEAVLAKTGVYASVTEGVSMRPLFKTHRDVVVLEAPTERLKKYDVALYRIGQKYVLHRVIGIDSGAQVYLIRGDNTFKIERIPYGAVIARLVSFNRGGVHYSVTDKGYLRYARFWNFIYPIRFIFHKSRAFLGRIKRAVFRKKRKKD